MGGGTGTGDNYLTDTDKRYLKDMNELVVKGSKALGGEKCYNLFCEVVLVDLRDYRDKNMGFGSRSTDIMNEVYKIENTIKEIKQDPKNIEKFLEKLK